MKKYILYIAAALLSFTGCSESEYELDNLVPGQYHKIMFVKNSGKHNKTLLDIEDDDLTSIAVVKSGSDPSLTADVSIRPLTDAELQSQYSDVEGVDYKELSAECYSLDQTELSFASSDRVKSFNLAIHPQAVKSLMATDNSATWVLPLVVESEKDSVNSTSNEYFIVVDAVVSPSVGFTSSVPDVKIVEKSKAADYTETLKLGIDTENKWDVTCKLGIDEDYVATYNRQNNANFQLLPADYYGMPTEVQLTSGASSVDVPVNIKSGTLPSGDYVLPVKLNEISRFSLSESRLIPIVIRVMGDQLDRTGWTATANTQENSGEGSGNGVPSCILDGKLNTYWHSQWNGGSHDFPHVITVDMQKEHTIDHVGLMQRQNNSYTDTKTVEIYVSSDNSEWTLAGTCELQKVLNEQIFKVNPTKGRYVKLNITEGYRGTNTSLTEFYVYGE